MSIDELGFRQIHLDFHTSEHMADVGGEFDADVFADTLVRAHVNSINLFARCMHGFIYYDTKAFPERHHPTLTRNLLVEQIEACQKRGIKTPLYTIAQWDNWTGEHHPEWCQLAEDGKLTACNPLGPNGGARPCLNTPFVDFFRASIDDIFDCVPVVDGFWIDIVGPQDCLCRRCRRDMLAEGLAPDDPDDRKKFGWQVYRRFVRETSEHIRAHKRDCTIYYNNGHTGPHNRPVIDSFTHLELETLPSYAGYGYLHFPATARYVRQLGVEMIGMTAKFHRMWADFHSFKNLAALEFECFLMLAMGARCCIGDQMFPQGTLCPATYELIGSVYEQVERKEPWCRGAHAVTDIGLLTPEEFTSTGRPERGGMPPAIWGAVRMLQEAACQFDVIDTESDFANYRLLILPDAIPLDEAAAAKLEQYVAAGGSVIATHQSGLTPAGDRFATDLFGTVYKGDAPFNPDFFMPTDAIGKDLPRTEHVMYEKGVEVEVVAGAEVLADAMVPAFNRSWRHYISHSHAPSTGKVGYPAAIQNGRAIYFAHPLFKQYHHNAARWSKVLIRDAIARLMPDPIVRTDAPSSAIITVNAQESENRWVVHVLHYIPERRGLASDIIEDVIPLHDVSISVKVPKKVASALCVPQGDPVPIETDGDYVKLTIPKIDGHQMIALNFE